mmetsp:Transcript_42692/g.97925  ORF Transcript_42692/g.97925 Transcript_42692/m.97925 type:complete len:105 (-) Transcript_42692:83-397(-)
MAGAKIEKLYFAKDWDGLTANFPHMDDPRFLSLSNKMNECYLRFFQFTRCARELGEEDVRCKYQYYRAQCSCPESHLEDWMEHRARGSCHMDVLPDRSSMHMRQ